MLRSPQRKETMSSSIRSVMKTPLAQLIGIKCAQCSLIYPQDLIEEHLITHIQPKYLMPYQDNSGAKKLSTALQLTDQTMSVRSSDIPSLNIEQFPRSQGLRKQIKLPSEIGVTAHDLPQLKKDIASYRGDARDLTSKFQGYVEQQSIQQMQLTQSISLKTEQAEIRQPQISMYRNALSSSILARPIIKTGKKVNPYEQKTPEKQKKYEIVTVSQELKSTSNEEIEHSGLLVVNIKKHRESTVPRQQINTSAKKSRRTAQTFEPTSIEESPSATVRGHSFQCPECLGFYCSHCKSDIPPQYRPVNMQHDLDPKIAQFYKKHVHRGNCRQCDKNLR